MKHLLPILLATASPAMAGTCKLSLSFSRTQGSGGDAGDYTDRTSVTYADGTTDPLDFGSGRGPFDDACSTSKLPYMICVTSNRNYKDGYMNYAAEHADFNSDYCTQVHDADPFSATNAVTCEFAC